MGRQTGGAASGTAGARQESLDGVALGLRLEAAGDRAGAEALYRRAAARDPQNAFAHHLVGRCLHAAGRSAEAADALARAVALRPRDPGMRADLGDALLAAGRRDEAAAAFRRVAKLDPAHPAAARATLGLAALDPPAQAVASLRRLIATQPGAPEAHLELGRMLHALGETEAGTAVHRDAVRAGVLDPGRLCEYGVGLFQAGREREGGAAVALAAELAPDDARLLTVHGFVLLESKRIHEALAAFTRATMLDPDYHAPFVNLGSLYAEAQRVNEAMQFYRRALALKPDSIEARHGLLDQRRHACEWHGIEEEDRAVTRLLEQTGARVAPFVRLAASAPPGELRRSGRVWAAGLRMPEGVALEPPPVPPPGRRIRLGYLSYDFFYHATALLAVALFEHHDRERFEVFAYSYGPDDGTPMRRRLVAAFDHFVEVGHLSSEEAARRIRADGIDILVDLKGYTLRARTEITALRPAPVQVNYLGYPGTMAADFVDYIVADAFIAPFSAADQFDERIVHLPGCYQPNDRHRRIAEGTPGREAFGLPPDGFVFCCFNNTYKITPSVFAVWMRLLAAVPDAVLWLFEANASAQDNLQYEAGAAGIDPARLVFAPKLDSPEHLARLRLADLFLDTLPVNAHTTASDALWAGLPVLTQAGETLVGRVAGSLLHAIGLPELVTHSAAEYEALALALAQDRPRLAALRARLAENRDASPLFDAAPYARNLEAAYRHMHERRCAGLPPAAFAVPDGS
ncbi:tetratricopeptide repeat protein [uncultured Methylobacterium sp.]|jgi:protein O-GlcNAc transferase|uniref:O-linked N-acetylglucosamine transferase, SPINDLY family protein n=1 Tax=uncultured Methylobacterium sp. TaxID=157278 RepID=UPI0026170739|nr:tetratricopeptide repeat protein [uncultured Methylobacterium sp.]